MLPYLHILLILLSKWSLCFAFKKLMFLILKNNKTNNIKDKDFIKEKSTKQLVSSIVKLGNTFKLINWYIKLEK